MKIKKISILAFAFVFSLALASIDANAQDSEELCAAIIDTAFSTLDLACADMPDNSACYAHAPVAAAFSADAGDITFDTPGDIAPLSSLEGLQTRGLDLGSEALGIALIRQQVDGVAVSLLLVGEGAIRNVAQPSADVTPTLMGTAPPAGANIRRAPNTTETIVWPLGPNEQVLVTGKLADGTWLRVEIPSRYGGIGWVYAPAITLNGDINSLRTVTPNSPPPVLDSGGFDRWQALTLETTPSDAPCVLAPQSGLIIQVDDPSQAATFEINGATLIVRGTAFLQAIMDDAMTIIALEGETELSSQETTETVQMGFKSSVSLDEDGQADGPPLLASVASGDDLRAIPLNALPRPVSLVPDIPSIDATPEATTEPTPAPEATPVPETATELSATEPLATEEPANTGFADVCQMQVTNPDGINVRSGPGTQYPIATYLTTGERPVPFGRARDEFGFYWFKIDAEENHWIREDTIEMSGDCLRAVPSVNFESTTPPQSSAAPAAGAPTLFSSDLNTNVCPGPSYLQGQPFTASIAVSLGGTWTASAGTTVTFTTNGGSLTEYGAYLRLLDLGRNTIADSGGSRTLTWTFNQDTQFNIFMAAKTGETVTLEVVCQ